jgi:hypothetical protein
MAGASGESDKIDAEDQIGELINLDAISRSGPPREPRPETKFEAVMRRVNSQALFWLLAAWEALVLVLLATRASGLPTHSPSRDVTRLVVGGLAAAISAPIVVGAIRSKQRDHAEGTERFRAMGMAWSSRWLLAGGGCMVFGVGLILSVR